MHITWLGHSAFKIETKTPLRDDVTILINPYQTPKSDLPRNLKSDISLLTNGKENTITLSGEPFIIDTPGEYEVKGVMIYAVPIVTGEKDKQMIYHLETEALSLIYFGDFRGKLTDELVEKLGSFDILLIPCGNNQALSAKEAAEIVNQMEPRVVVPHSFNPPSRKDPFEAVDPFAKLLGQKEKEWLPKFKINKKDLPQEETKLILLEKT
ncbi:MAG: MBL fold metallo-hydrolase [Patescibacteria group bacterium]